MAVVLSLPARRSPRSSRCREPAAQSGAIGGRHRRDPAGARSPCTWPRRRPARVCRGRCSPAIGWVESRHGHGDVDPATGDVSPPIFGPPLDGRPGFALIRDPSQPDGFARAVGPMQFLTTTWARWGRVAPDRPPGCDTGPPQRLGRDLRGRRLPLRRRAESLTDLEAAILRYNRSDAVPRRRPRQGERVRPRRTGSGRAAASAATATRSSPPR